jgi:thiosulfate dehydrogenase [quinone] large subunit
MANVSAAAPEQKAPKWTLLREHPIETALFNNTGPITFFWLLVRLWLGYQWAHAGWEKINNPKWMDGAKIREYWTASLADYGKPNSDVAYDWYSGFLKGLLDSGSHSWFGPLIAWAELIGGVALMLGLFTGVVALLLAFMNFNYMLAGSAGVNPIYLLLALLLVLAWKNAGWWGLDRFVLSALRPPNEPGSLVKEPPPAATNAPPDSNQR